MTTPLTVETAQYIWCSICLAIQPELEAAGKDPQLALTITRGEAVCAEHRNRVDGFSSAVLGAKRYLERESGGGYQPRGRR